MLRAELDVAWLNAFDCLPVSMYTARMRSTALSLAEVRTALLPVLRRYQITRAIIFGSLARGEASARSDVDLILVQRTTKRFLDRYEGLLYELNLALPQVGLDVLIYTPEEFERMRHGGVVAAAVREGQVIYESN